MKNLLLILFLLPVFSFAQVTIGKNGASPSSNSVLLEFGNDGNKGIVLPYINGELSDAVNGTVIFDTSVKRVKVKTGAGWVDLSGENGVVDTSLQDSLPTNPNARVVIGDPASTAPGILVLESTSKAMVMPKVAKYTDIVDPAPGMIVYLTSSNKIAVYNGSTWAFWGP